MVLQAVLSRLMAAAGLAFVLLAVLAGAGLADPRLAAAAFGVAVLAAGADEVAGALVAGWVPRGRWRPAAGGPPGGPGGAAGAPRVRPRDRVGGGGFHGEASSF